MNTEELLVRLRLLGVEAEYEERSGSFASAYFLSRNGDYFGTCLPTKEEVLVYHRTYTYEEFLQQALDGLYGL